MLNNYIIETATEFQKSHPGLDENNNEYCYCHDFIHAVTGLGISEKDESLVLEIEYCLGGGFCQPNSMLRITSLIALIPQDCLIVLIETLTTHFAS